MRSYTYRFRWTDKNGKFQRSYIEAASEGEAINDFETSTKLTVKEAKVEIHRLA